EIKRQQELKDEYSSNQLVQQYRAPIIKRPNFMQEEKVISAAEKGTIMHTVMQHLPFTKKLNETEINNVIDKLVEDEILLKEAAKTIDVKAIEEFYTTPLADELMKATSIYRELPFSFSLPANDVYADWKEKTD